MTGPDSSLGPAGRYRLVRRLGAGGMGEVWEADDTVLGRRVALKVLAQELADDARATKRFVREARATAKLTHRNVTRVYDFGRDGGLPYLVMELLEGDTLADRLAGGPLPPAEAARIGAVVADALDAAHGRGSSTACLIRPSAVVERNLRVWCRRRKASSAQRSTASPPGVVLDAIRSS